MPSTDHAHAACGAWQLYFRRGSLALFQLQSGFVLLDKGFQFGRGVQQAGPLLVIKGDGKTAQSIDADATFFADPEFHDAAALLGLDLFFKFLQFRF